MTVRITELDRPRATAGNTFKLSDFHREVVGLICDYIKSNLNGDLSLDVIARRAGYSRSHFSRMFRMTHGMTVQAYVTQARIEAAAALLRDTDQTIDSIMRQVGYCSSSGFVRVFMARYHRAPSLYRGHAQTAAKRAAARLARAEEPK